jgi:hypothetical protein
MTFEEEAMKRTMIALFTVTCFCVGAMLAADPSRAGGPDDHVKESVKHAKEGIGHAKEAVKHLEESLKAGGDAHAKEALQHAKDALKHAEEALAHAEHGADQHAPAKK